MVNKNSPHTKSYKSVLIMIFQAVYTTNLLVYSRFSTNSIFSIFFRMYDILALHRFLFFFLFFFIISKLWFLGKDSSVISYCLLHWLELRVIFLLDRLTYKSYLTLSTLLLKVLKEKNNLKVLIFFLDCFPTIIVSIKKKRLYFFLFKLFVIQYCLW